MTMNDHELFINNIVFLSTDSKDFKDGCAWYTLDGKRLNGVPTTKGLYINNGKKVVIK